MTSQSVTRYTSKGQCLCRLSLVVTADIENVSNFISSFISVSMRGEIHTPDTKYSHIKLPYFETTLLHSKLTNPSAPMAWLI